MQDRRPWVEKIAILGLLVLLLALPGLAENPLPFPIELGGLKVQPPKKSGEAFARLPKPVGMGAVITIKNLREEAEVTVKPSDEQGVLSGHQGTKITLPVGATKTIDEGFKLQAGWHVCTVTTQKQGTARFIFKLNRLAPVYY